MNHNPFLLSGKKFLITGAASGIGKETSKILSSLGANLILLDIDEVGLEQTRGLCRNSDKIIALDLSETEKIKDAITDVIENFGRLNGFVHLAGKSYISPLKAINQERCDDIYKVNTYAAIELAKVFIHKNVFCGENGSIVLISSVYGNVGSVANVAYAMSKSALHGITRSLSIELASKGIRVNCVAPGFIQTNMLEKNLGSFSPEYLENLKKLHPLGLGQASDIAYCIAFLLSDAARWITGAVINVDGGFTAQ